MRNNIKRIFTAVISFALALSIFSVPSFATENDDILSNLTNQAEQQNKGQVYLNEPLDNAMPVIYKYEIGDDGYIVPGEEFTIKFFVYNPAVVSKVGNIRIVVTQGNGLVYPKYGATNSVYIGYLSALSFTEGEITLVASKDITEEELPLNIYLSYTDNYKTDNQQQFSAMIPVSSSGKLNLKSVDVPSTMYVGSNNRLSVSYSNTGLSTINDVVLHLSGDSINTQEISLGSIGSNSSVTSDIYVEFLEAGQQIVKVNFSYTDSNGQEKVTDPVDYSFDVKNYEVTTDDSYTNYMNRRIKINNIITIGALAACVIVLVIAFMAFRKERSIATDASRGKKE